MIPAINFKLTNPNLFDIFYLEEIKRIGKGWLVESLQLVYNLCEHFDRLFRKMIHEKNHWSP